jgi:DNA ligase-1
LRHTEETMPDLNDGETAQVQGSGSKPYELKNTGGVYSCTCPAWRNQSVAIERRTCKHLRKFRGDEAETARVGSDAPVRAKKEKEDGDAPPLLLAENWDSTLDPAGWWLSEKLDGVRAFWDGKQLWSRLGNLFHAPDWFLKGLPDVPLDGELWLGRKKFQRAVSIVRRQDKGEQWREIRYVLFDAPKLEKGFEDRLAFVRECIASNKPEFALAHEHMLCQGVEHLRQELSRLEGLGAEGLMMRRAGSRYESGRSSTLLKVKSFHDAEAKVLKHQAGAGRHKGRLGALLVEMPDGTTFSVGTGFSDAERENPPPVGGMIVYRYQELSDGGVPRFPSYVGVRAEGAPSKPAPPVKVAKVAKVETVHPVTPKPAPKPAAKTESAGARRFEFVEGKSSKFWEISVDGTEVTVRYGRIGSDGQTNVKDFADEAAAQRHADKLIEEKTEKGYEEVES